MGMAIRVPSREVTALQKGSLFTWVSGGQGIRQLKEPVGLSQGVGDVPRVVDIVMLLSKGSGISERKRWVE